MGTECPNVRVFRQLAGTRELLRCRRARTYTTLHVLQTREPRSSQKLRSEPLRSPDIHTRPSRSQEMPGKREHDRRLDAPTRDGNWLTLRLRQVPHRDKWDRPYE